MTGYLYSATGPATVSAYVVYCSAYDVWNAISPGDDSAFENNRDRIDQARVVGSRWVDTYIGNTVEEGDPGETLEEPSVDYRMRQAAIIASVRFYKSGDAPFGLLGDSERYVSSRIPDAELVLTGMREAFGFA